MGSPQIKRLTRGGCHASVKPTGELECRKVLDRVEDGHGDDDELPFGEEPL